MGPVLPFSLLDESAEPFQSTELVGRIWIASMVCSECPQVNPEQMDTLAKVRGKTKNMVDAFRLVSFSVDSQRDRPDQLATMEKEHGLGKRWIFLTSSDASKTAPDEVLDNIFSFDESHLLAKRAQAPGELPPRLSYMIALIDGNMCVRAYYDLRTLDVLDQLMGGINNLLHADSDSQECVSLPTSAGR